MPLVARLLYLTSPHLHGEDVHKVQLELRRHGHSPGPIDGHYGASTAAAVRSFQRECQVTVDGVVGPATILFLEHANPLPPSAAPLPGREPPGLQALAWMHDRIGLKESPPDSNRCAITQEFGLVGPWCMMAVSLAFKHGANLILGDDRTPPAWGYWRDRGFAYVPAFEAWAKTRGFWRGRATPVKGDVVCFDWDGDGVPDHVGIVDQYVGGGQFNSVEGNTGIGSDSNGGEIMLRRRYVSQVAGFARIVRTRP